MSGLSCLAHCACPAWNKGGSCRVDLDIWWDVEGLLLHRVIIIKENFHYPCRDENFKLRLFISCSLKSIICTKDLLHRPTLRSGVDPG